MAEEYVILSEEELLTGIAKVNPVKPHRNHANSRKSSTVHKSEDHRHSNNRSSGCRKQEEARRSNSRPSGSRKQEETRRSNSRPSGNRNKSDGPSKNSKAGQTANRKPRKPATQKKKKSLLEALLR